MSFGFLYNLYLNCHLAMTANVRFFAMADILCSVTPVPKLINVIVEDKILSVIISVIMLNLPQGLTLCTKLCCEDPAEAEIAENSMLAAGIISFTLKIPDAHN